MKKLTNITEILNKLYLDLDNISTDIHSIKNFKIKTKLYHPVNSQTNKLSQRRKHIFYDLRK